MTSLQAALNDYRDARARLLMVTTAKLRSQSVVRVDRQGSYLIGIVTGLDTDPEYVNVYVESGNIWSYRVETIVDAIDDIQQWPRWVRDTKLRWKLEAQKRREETNGTR